MNITITALCGAVAFPIGGIEIAGLLSSELHLRSWLGDAFASFNLNTADYMVVGSFVTVWVVAISVWRSGRLEQRWEPTVLKEGGAL